MHAQPSLLNVPAPRGEVVYYVTDGCYIKIGRTKSLRRRGGELRTQMIYSLPGGPVEEREHHRMWAANRIGSSEWFRVSEDLLLWLFARTYGQHHMREVGVIRHLALALERERVAA